MADTWDGDPLADANVLKVDVHYRIHDVDTGKLLGFGTALRGVLGAMTEHCRRVADANPGRFLVVRQYDRPAGPQFENEAG